MARRLITTTAAVLGLVGLTAAEGCPFAAGALGVRAGDGTDNFMDQFAVDDSKGYMTDDVGGQIQEQDSLKAGVRGPTLLEDFIFRQKITHCTPSPAPFRLSRRPRRKHDRHAPRMA